MSHLDSPRFRNRATALLFLALALAPLNGCGKKTSSSTTTQTTTQPASVSASALTTAGPMPAALPAGFAARVGFVPPPVVARLVRRGPFQPRTRIGAIPAGARRAVGRIRWIARGQTLASQDTVDEAEDPAGDEQLKNEAETDSADAAVGGQSAS